MQRLSAELPGLTPDQLEEVFDSLDEDKNGFLTMDEFTRGFGQSFCCFLFDVMTIIIFLIRYDLPITVVFFICFLIKKNSEGNRGLPKKSRFGSNYSPMFKTDGSKTEICLI